MRLLSIVVALAGCQASQAQLTMVFPADGGRSCAQETDLSCVNYLLFKVDADGEFSTHCVKVSQTLTSLCDVSNLADGRELFRFPPSANVTVEVDGMAVFPATSCDTVSSCGRRTIFQGTTPSVRIGDLAGGALELPVKMSSPCGPKEQFFFLPPGRTCNSVCGEGLTVCDGIQGGCLCKSATATPDGGL